MTVGVGLGGGPCDFSDSLRLNSAPWFFTFGTKDLGRWTQACQYYSLGSRVPREWRPDPVSLLLQPL